MDQDRSAYQSSMSYELVAPGEPDSVRAPTRSSSSSLLRPASLLSTTRNDIQQPPQRFLSVANTRALPESVALLGPGPVIPQTPAPCHNDCQHQTQYNGHADDVPGDSKVQSDGDHSRRDRRPALTLSPAPTWQPFWLAPMTLAILSLTLLGTAAVIVAMLVSSKRNQGIANALQQLHYLWRFGPTATFTLLSVFWSRVELQTLRYTPWRKATDRSSQEEEGIRDLDYTSMLLPTVLVQSFRRRHSTAFLAASVTILLRAVVVLSPALFNPILIHRTSATPIHVADSFNSGPLGYNMTGNVSMVPFYIAQAMHSFSMVPPFGLTKEFAYQTFGHIDSTDSGNSTIQRGTSDRLLRAVVDGLFINMTCRDLESFSGVDEEAYQTSGKAANLTLHFESCAETPILVNSSFSRTIPDSRDYFDLWEMGSGITHDNGRPCSTLPQQHEQFVYWSHDSTASWSSASRVVGVICSPSTWLSKVRIEDDGTSPNITVLAEGDEGHARPVPVQTNIWDMVVESISARPQTWSIYTPTGVLPEGPVFASYMFMGVEPEGGTRGLRNHEIMRESITNLTSAIGPAVAHTFLRRDDSRSDMKGSSTETLERLLVSSGVGVAMSVLCLVSSGSAFWIMTRSMLSPPVWRRDPTTILGAMVVFSDAHKSESPHRPTDTEHRERLKTDWQNSSYAHPPLRIWARSVFVVYGLGLMIGLLVSLATSRQNHGLATIDQDSRIASTVPWKSIPALAMVCVALYSNSCDAVTRSLAIFSKLCSSSSSTSSTSSFSSPWKGDRTSIFDISLLDMLGLRALYYSICLGLPAVSIMQVLAILCSFLTILSSVLFDVKITPKATDITIQPQSWFSDPEIPLDNSRFWRDGILGGLLLMRQVSDLTYPRHTWGDLVFPTIIVSKADIEAAGGEPREGTVVDIAIPAARLTPRCEKAEDVTVTLSEDDRSMNNTPPFLGVDATVTQSLTCPNGTVLKLSGEHTLLSSVNQQFNNTNGTGDWFLIDSFAPYHLNSSRADDDANCEPAIQDLQRGGYNWELRHYIWGRALNKSSTELDFFSAWRCNYTWSEVTVDTRLVQVVGSGEYDIDYDHTPSERSRLGDSFKPHEPPFGIPDFEGNLETGQAYSPGVWPDLRDGHDIKSEYSCLFQPYGPFDLGDFGKPQKEQEILRAFHENVAFLGAQMAGDMQRKKLNESSASRPNGFDPNDIQPLLATAWDTRRQRLVQNEAVTYALVGVLGLVVAVHVWALVSTILVRGWRRERETGRWLLIDFELRGLAPRGFSSMARMEALLRGSNYTSVIRTVINGSDLKREYLAPGVAFRMGWFFNKRDQVRVFTIGVMGDAEFEFLGD